MLRNGDFSEDWETLPAIETANWLRNQRPFGWQIEWLEVGQPLYDDPGSTAQGIPECVHKLSTQLPDDEQKDAVNALILAGDRTYKIFNSGAAFGATLSQIVTGLESNTQGRLVVPVQTHLHGDHDSYAVESGVWVNGVGGWVNGGTMGDRRWYRHELEFTVPDSGQAEVVIRVKSKWNRPKDFFLDDISLTAVAATVPSGIKTPQPVAPSLKDVPATTQTRTKRVTAEAGLWLRTGPSTNDGRIQLMAEGTTVTVLQEQVDDQGLWDLVQLGEVTGYAFRDYLANSAATFTEHSMIAANGQPASRLGVGMNINPDAPHSNPINDGSLRGINWVRFPFKAADKHRTVAASFAEYDPVIQGYANQGIGSLVVLNQQTIAGGDAPWPSKNWAGMNANYADKFAAAAIEIAARYAHLGDKVAYQIWNEGDNPKTPWVSVYVPPEHFALILSRAAQAIRTASPQSPIVFGGLSTGPDEATAYVQACRQALGGDLPVDAIGIHPYGRWPIAQPFSDWGFGRLDDVFAIYKRAMPDKPLWITEVGIPGGDKPLGEQYYPAVAKYMRDMYATVASNHVLQVPVIIWFAWSDNMENAGVVTSNGSRKAHIFDAFTAVRDRQIIS
jgi:uncharacterized protein YgiM (DUF1202 family)